MKTRLFSLRVLVASGVLWLATLVQVLAQGTAFTYQGRLSDGANPASGNYDLRFALFNSAGSGSQQGNALTNLATGLSDGLFTVTLDFGNQFSGAERWLEIGVRTNGGGAFSLLSPRQKLTAMPYAITASNLTGVVAASQLSGTIPAANIGAGSITTVMLATGAVGSNQLSAGAVTTASLADGAVTAAKVVTVSNWFALTIANPAPASGDNFGNAVAVGTDRVLIGAHGDDTGASSAGAAYLFNANGTLLTALTNPTPAANDKFGVAVAVVGTDRVLIGASGDGTGASGAGAAYLFNTNGTLLTTFTNPTPAANDNFGVAVAVVGTDRVLIGAATDDTGALNAGAAYLFGANGTLLATLTNPTPGNDDSFGYAVAAVGTDRLLIGALGDDTGAIDAGAAYLFNTNGTLLTTFTNPTPAAEDYFGYAVVAVGTGRLLIGAPGDDSGAIDAGAVYLFSTNGTLLATFTNPTPAVGDYFGSAVVAVGTDRLLIGTPNDDTGAIDAGVAYLFNTNGTLLTTFTNSTPATEDRFGYAVAAVGADRVLIGTGQDDAGATDAGVAYLFSIATFTPALVADSVRTRSVTAASLEDGAVTAVKIGGVLFSSQIPDLDASKITSGTLPDARLATISTAGKVLNSATTATSANTPNTIVVRNGSGSFAAGTVTASTHRFPSAQPFTLQLTANSFVPDNPAEDYNRGAGLISPAGGDTTLQFHAPVQLPHGATVTKLTGVFADLSATNNFSDIDLRLEYFTTDNFSAVTMADIASESTTLAFAAGRVEFEDPSIVNAAIDNSSRAYMLFLQFTVNAATANTRFYGARIDYTLDALSP